MTRPWISLFLKPSQSNLSLVLIFISISIFWFWHFGEHLTWKLLGACLFTALLLSLAFIDFSYLILPNELVFPLLFLGLLFNLNSSFTSINSALMGVIIGYGVLFFLYHLFFYITGKEGLGLGDLKLLAAILAWTGLESIAWIFLLSGTLSLLFFIYQKIFTSNPSPQIPFGPGLAIAGLLSLAFGNMENILENISLFGS